MVEKIVGIEGPMFSGKTLELLQIAERETIAGRKIQIFKPKIDNRGEGLNVVKSRFGKDWEAVAVDNPRTILDYIQEDTNTVLVDEANFFSRRGEDGEFDIVKVFRDLVNRDIRVVFAGLPRDFRGEPFGPMGDLLARAQEHIPVRAVCDYNESGYTCGKEATETQRFVDGEPANWNDPIVLVGDKQEGYAARCIAHHVVRNKPTIVFDSQK